MVRRRGNPGDIEKLLLDTAVQDGKKVRIGFGQDPGQAGKSQAHHLVRALSGFTVLPATESGDKLTRFGPFSSQCRAGNVKIRRGSWNEELFRVLEGFPDLAHDDEVDACSGALEMSSPNMKHWGYTEWLRQEAEKVNQQRRPEPPKPTWAPAPWNGSLSKKPRKGSRADLGAPICSQTNRQRTKIDLNCGGADRGTDRRYGAGGWEWRCRTIDQALGRVAAPPFRMALAR